MHPPGPSPVLVPREGSELGADVPEAAYVGLSLLGEFERRRDMADEYAGRHSCLDVLRLARCQLERNRIFDLGCRCYGVFPRGAVDIREPAGHRSADDFVVHPNLGLNSRPRQFGRPGEVDTAETRLQCRDLQGRFIDAAWTRATGQQKSDKHKGQRPDLRPHMPHLDIENAQFPNRRQTTNGWQLPCCFLAPSTQLGIHASIVQHFSLRAISATAREQIALDVDEG